MILSRVLVGMVFALIAGPVLARLPPSSCAGKFIGGWQRGTSNMGTLTPDGQALCSGNPFCTQGTWTCQGNSLTYKNSAGTYVYTLQSPGVMTYGSIVVTRIGGGDAAAAAAAKAEQAQCTGSASQGDQQGIGSHSNRISAARSCNRFARARRLPRIRRRKDRSRPARCLGRQRARQGHGKDPADVQSGKASDQVLTKRNREQAEKDAQEQADEK